MTNTSIIEFHGLLLDLLGSQIAANCLLLQKVKEEHPQNFRMVLRPITSHEQPLNTWNPDVVSIVDAVGLQPVEKVALRDGKAVFDNDIRYELVLTLFFQLKPSEKHPKQIRVGIPSLFLLSHVIYPADLFTFWIYQTRVYLFFDWWFCHLYRFCSLYRALTGGGRCWRILYQHVSFFWPQLDLGEAVESFLRRSTVGDKV